MVFIGVLYPNGILGNHEYLSHPALLIADYLLAHRKQELTTLHVVKLTYICHGWHLGLYGVPLINEKVEAWKYGPVIKTVYDVFKKYHAGVITHMASCNTDLSDVEKVKEWEDAMFCNVASKQKTVLDKVLDAYGDLSASTLIKITHRDDSPWARCYVKGMPYSLIPDYITQSYYKALADGRIE